MAEKAGLVSAVEIATEEQAELVEQADAETARDLFGFETIEQGRGRGRPPGARNKATEEQRRLILATGQSPLAYLASIWRDDNRLTKDRVAAAIAALPYIHRKQPVAVDLKGGGLVKLELVVPDFSELGFGEELDDGALELQGTVIDEPDENDSKSKGYEDDAEQS